jgi:3-keto-5-aminohexanoate cleavage enzyme
MEKLIITAAITGGAHGKKENPNIPEQPAEQIQQTLECWRAGASMIHIHARDKNGQGSQDPEIYRQVKEGIRATGCDIIINFTTGGTQGMLAAERLLSTDAGPEVASLNMGTLQAGPFPDGTYYCASNPPNEVEWFAREMKKKGIKPEMEVYSPIMMQDVRMLIDKGVVDKPYLVNFVLGIPGQGSMYATWQNLTYCASLLPLDSKFTVCAVGGNQLPMTTMSILIGGHARVGMEDNIYYAKGEKAKSNAQLVERTARITRELQREIATPEEARKILGIKELN